MENIRLDLFIDQPASKNPDLFKWVSFVEKYLVYGLKQKGIEVSMVSEFKDSLDVIQVYLPVFTKSTLESEGYLQKVQTFYEEKELSRIVKLGLIKESAVIDKTESLFPEMKFSRMYLLDIDNGLEISDKELWKKENFNFFLFKIFDLCNELERIFSSLKSDQVAVATAKKAVYLAEASPDLIAVREGIRRELLRQGYEVYPEKIISGTPKEMEKAVVEFLQKSVLSIHLMGKLYQEAKADGIPRLEFENKTAANYFLNKKDSKKHTKSFKRIIWMPDNLIVTNEIQSKVLDQILKDKKLYAGAEIIKSSVEELKDIILEKLEEGETENNGGMSGSGEGEGTKNVYIVTSEKNREEGESVKEILTTLGYQALMNDGTKSATMGNIKKCDSVLFYYHNENPSWLKSKMCEVDKYRSWEYSSTFVKKGVITFEDQELPVDDIFKGIIHVHAQQKLEQDALLSFLHKAY